MGSSENRIDRDIVDANRSKKAATKRFVNSVVRDQFSTAGLDFGKALKHQEDIDALLDLKNEEKEKPPRIIFLDLTKLHSYPFQLT